MAMSHAAEHCRGQLRDLGLSPEEDGVELRCWNEGCIGWYQMWALQAFFSFYSNTTGGFCSFSHSSTWFSDSTWFNFARESAHHAGFFFGQGGFGAYELSSEVRRAAEYKLNLFGDRVRAVQTSVDVAMVCFHVKSRWNLGKAAKHIETLDISF